MKKIAFLLFMGILMSACSRDGGDPAPIPIPDQYEIKLIFEASEANAIAFFYLKGSELEIDWGDGSLSTQDDIDPQDIIRHEYAQPGEYIITVASHSQIDLFGNTYSANYNVQACPFKNVAIGDKIEIAMLRIQASGIGNLVVCSGASLGYSEIRMDQKNWGMIPFESATVALYMMGQIEEFVVRGSASSQIYIGMDPATSFESILIEDCKNLMKLEVSTDGLGSNLAMYGSIENLTLKNLPALNDFYSIHARIGQLDMSQAAAPMVFRSVHMIVNNNILFDDQIREVYLQGSLTDSWKSDIKELDISMCENLKILGTSDIPTLESIKTSDRNKALETINLSQYNFVSKIKELRICDLPELRSLSFVVSPKPDFPKTDMLESLDFSNCPKLRIITVTNTNLKQIKAGQNPGLSSLNLEGNDIPEDGLIKLISSLSDDKPEGGGKRLAILSGNPGFNDKVSIKADELEHWEVR